MYYVYLKKKENLVCQRVDNGLGDRVEKGVKAKYIILQMGKGFFFFFFSRIVAGTGECLRDTLLCIERARPAVKSCNK